MATKYYIPFKANDDVSWQVHINTDAYSGNAIGVRGASGQAAVLTYAGETDDAFGVFIKSTLAINCFNEGQIDIRELQRAQDKDFTVRLYREDVLMWQGYLSSDGISRTLQATPYTLSLSAICGLGMLENIDYFNINLRGTGVDYSRCPMNYIRNILFYNLGISLPIRWTNNLQCTAFLTQDVFTGGVQWAVDDEGYSSYQTSGTGEAVKPQKCAYILEGILRSMQCRIYQSKGMWVIRRIPDIAKGNAVAFKQLPGTLDPMVIQTGNEDLKKQIGRDGYLFVSEDQVVTSIPGIKSCTVTYTGNTRENKLPNGSQDENTGGLNAKPLYWGFYDDSNTTLDPALPLDGRSGFSTKIARTLNTGLSFYTLKSTGGSLREKGLPIDTQTIVKQINFGFLFSPVSGFPVDGDGYINWTNTPFLIQVVFNVGIIKYYLNEFGFWQTTQAFISIVIDGLKLGDVGKVDFDKFQGIIMPTPLSQPVAGDTSNIEVVFILQQQQEYEIDNIYIETEEANDVYESSLADTKNTLTDERELNISSSFGGYIISNFMSEWSKSGDECFFRDGAIYEGTLTGLTANAIMRFRYQASEIYNGSIFVENKNWSFDEIYLIDSFGSSIFLPINASYNIEKCQVNGLVAMESRNDSLTLAEKYYSSNDNQLSN